MGVNAQIVERAGGPKWLRRIAEMLDEDVASGRVGQDQATFLMLVASSWEPSAETIAALESDDPAEVADVHGDA